MAEKIIIGTRNSKLALAQGEEFRQAILAKFPDKKIDIRGFTTTGDKILSKNLSEVGGKGLFTKEIEEALLNKQIDIAVHSVKDLPAETPIGLIIKATLKRKDPTDAFISKKYNSLKNLAKGTIIGTSSIRRKALLLNKYPHLNIVNLRGNVNTRLKKLNSSQIDGTILASCGLQRIGKQDEISQRIDIEEMLPAIGQGAICAECRDIDKDIINILENINHQQTEICINAERAFLSEIDGSCRTPIAAYAVIKDNKIYLQTLIAHPEGRDIYKLSEICDLTQGKELGQAMADKTKREAKKILAAISF